MRAGEVERAVAEVAELRQMTGWTADQWYDLACVYSVASTKDAGQTRAHGDRAVELLRKAVAAGWSDAAHMKEDADLDPLRGRDDFRKLLAELEKKFPPKKEPAGPEKK